MKPGPSGCCTGRLPRPTREAVPGASITRSPCPVTKLPMPAWLDHLKRRFSPQVLRVGTEGAASLGGGVGGTLALVGRELCLFLVVDASRVPPKQRAAFIGHAVRRAAPFPDPEHDVLWCGSHAAIWYWSRDRVRELVGMPARPRAEALYRGDPPAGDTTELLAWEAITPDGASPVL